MPQQHKESREKQPLLNQNLLQGNI